MPFIDAHCHLHDDRIIEDIDGFVSRARNADVRYMASCSTMENNFRLTQNLAERYPEILPCFGIHPWFLDSCSSQWRANLQRHLAACPSGIGETGIDFMDKTADRAFQIQVFEHHLALAIEMKRPINIHVRKAWDTFIKIMKKMGPLPVPGIVHSYSGSADLVPLIQKFGLFISFSGSVTKPGAKKVVQAFKAAASLGCVVFETDTPDIYPHIPEPDPSGLNEPKNLPAIARIAANRIDGDYDALCRQAFDNSLQVFEPLLQGAGSAS